MATTLSARDAAKRMGVKVETLYAYVSRGLLERQPGPDGRTSVFDARAIEALARRGRPRQSSRSTSLSMLIETELTSLSPQGVRYRGALSSDLARSQPFENVAELLWTGRLPAHIHPWSGGRVDVSLPTDAGLRDALRMIVARAGVDGGHGHADARQVAAAGQWLIATMVDSLPVAGDGRTPRLVLPSGGAPLRATIAGRLWSRLSPRRPAPGMLGVLNAALVLLADHELAASTLAVRVAASTRADPVDVVATGLGVLSGPLHGGASALARDLLDDAAKAGAARALSAWRLSGRRAPGFGHTVYAGADPRAALLIELLRATAGRTRMMSIADDVAEAVASAVGQAPNIDFALASLTAIGGMPRDAGEAIMAVARTAGWLAHAIEEYDEAPLRFRPRALYTGPSVLRPGATRG